MAKVLQIVGGKKEKVISAAHECPLRNIEEDYCGHPDNECLYCTLGDRIGDSCPLPDATEAPADVWPDDGNHRLGPNGERLIAVDHVSCKACFLFGQPCYSQNAVLTCCYDYRKDRRNIHWELAGDRT